MFFVRVFFVFLAEILLSAGTFLLEIKSPPAFDGHEFFQIPKA